MLNQLLAVVLLVLALSLAPYSAEAKIYLVAVGLSDYPGHSDDLHLPANDAGTICWLYKTNKHAVTRLITNGKATVANIKSAMRSMFSAAKGDDIVVFFFSGHGTRGSFYCYDGYLSYKDVCSIMASVKCKNKMIFADACHVGSMRQNNMEMGSLGSNVMLLLACRSNEESAESTGMTNGFFTYALQHALRGNADTNRDRVITAKELFTFVSANVIRISRGEQHPVMWGNFSDNMAVMRW